MRQLINLWMDSKQNDQPYYIGRAEPEINHRLCAINAPSEISRAPRSITERCYWKASEWRAFIFYSLVILKGILPTAFLKHLFLFVYGVYCLLGDTIEECTVDNSEAFLTKFVIEVEELYGLKHCSFNIHQLLHLAQSVRDCGPIWSSSAFMLESHNHILNKMFHGTQYVPKQIVESFVRDRKINLMAKRCINEETNWSVINLFNSLRNGKPGRYGRYENLTTTNVYGVGKERIIHLAASQQLAIKQLLGREMKKTCGLVFYRFVANHNFYSSVSYIRAKKHINHYISFQHDRFKYGIIIGLVLIKPECMCEVVALQYCNCICYSIVLVEPMTIGAIYIDI